MCRITGYSRRNFVWQNFDHQNIINILEICKDKKKFVVILEIFGTIDSANLKQFRKNQKDRSIQLNLLEFPIPPPLYELYVIFFCTSSLHKSLNCFVDLQIGDDYNWNNFT